MPFTVIAHVANVPSVPNRLCVPFDELTCSIIVVLIVSLERLQSLS